MTVNLLSLFCGAGGLDLGFTQEGFPVKLAIDLSEAAIETHKFNFPDSNAQQHDLLSLGTQGLLKLCSQYFYEKESIGIIGGPPCQGFSRGNIGSKKDDPRNLLATHYIQSIKVLAKKFDVNFVIFENVMGLKDKKHSETYNNIIAFLNEMNFDVFEYQLNAADFGVPQVRKRIIIIALKKNSYSVKPSFEMLTKHKTVKDFIHALPEPIFYKRNLEQSSIPFHPNHWTMFPKSPKFSDPDGFANKTRSFRVINWDKPSPTIAFGNREIYIHPSKHRRLSIHESLLLQGFPSNFVLKGNFSQQVTQVSNAVPPPMARNIALKIKETLL